MCEEFMMRKSDERYVRRGGESSKEEMIISRIMMLQQLHSAVFHPVVYKKCTPVLLFVLPSFLTEQFSSDHRSVVVGVYYYYCFFCLVHVISFC